MSASPKRPPNTGFTVVELVVTIAIVGILAAIAMSTMSNVIDNSKTVLAKEKVEVLNNAVKKYEQINWEITTGVDATHANEFKVLKSLQWTDAGAFGSPYLPPAWKPEESNKTTDHRVMWNGQTFELLQPGDAGAGIKINFEDADMNIANPVDTSPPYLPEGHP